MLWALTLALAGLAAFNLAERSRVSRPDDGVVWVDSQRGVQAARVDPGGPAAQVGVRPGDLLIEIDGRPVTGAVDTEARLERIGAWSQTSYSIARGDIVTDYRLVTREAPKRRAATTFQLVLGVAYLLIGLFVWRRSPHAKLVRLFYAFCLSSFALYVLSYSGVLDPLDRLVYWTDAWATVITPALFLHFCLAFPYGLRSGRARAWAAGGYGLGIGMAVVRHLAASGILGSDRPALQLSGLLDRVDYGFLGAALLAGAVVLHLGRREEEELLVRTQRRWLAYGAIWGVAPFVAFYVIPFVAGKIPGPNHTLAIFPLALIPLAFAFAIARQRFMDVELVFRRSAAYTFATAAILGLFYLGVWALSGFADPSVSVLGPAAWVGSVVLGAIAFNPLRKAIQYALDKRYYRERYDYRRTLAEFAAELGAKTDPEQMLALVAQRLQRTLAAARAAIFTRGADERFELSYGLGLDAAAAPSPDLLESDPAREGLRYRFVDSAARDGLSYYVPCHVQGRLIAWIGLGLTESGEYLTTEDLSLVEAISGSFAIALENARLYRSLEQKAAQYQRLKDYNENIVESLHVGILAVDLDDRVESWNTQLELLFGISRRDAVGRKLAELLPATLVAECDKAREDDGVHNVYKLAVRGEDFPESFRPAEEAMRERERILDAAIAPLVAKDFEPIGRLIIVDDVTERIELEEQVLQADKLTSIGLLAAGVAHEVNTPLAVISSYAQMLAKRADGDEAQQKILEKITKQTFRASEIVNSLLSFSRTSSNEFSKVALNETIEETLSLVDPQFRKAGVRIERNLDPELPRVSGVANKLQQVLLNLFLNARDAMPDGGVLEVTSATVTDASGSQVVRISVSDSGPGIPREKLGRIFDPFFTTKGAKGGTGLGLAVSYGIVQEHDGALRAESAAGRGARFTIELPAVMTSIHA